MDWKVLLVVLLVPLIEARRSYNPYAFAAIKNNGSVVTWGLSSYGGDSPSSQLQSDVVSVYSTLTAFAALKSSGDVVTWGSSDNGGDSSSVLFTASVVDIVCIIGSALL